MTPLRLLAAAVLTASLLPSAAFAEEEAVSIDDFLGQPRSYTVEEIGSDLAYGFCPLFLAGQFALDAPQLAERGFGSTIDKAPHPKYGEISIVTVERDDGRVAFGGAPGKICMVIIDGPQRDAALGALRERMSWTGLDFKPTEDITAPLPETHVETFKAPTDGQFLYVQLTQSLSVTANPLVTAQLFAMES